MEKGEREKRKSGEEKIKFITNQILFFNATIQATAKADLASFQAQFLYVHEFMSQAQRTDKAVTYKSKLRGNGIAQVVSAHREFVINVFSASLSKVFLQATIINNLYMR